MRFWPCETLKGPGVTARSSPQLEPAGTLRAGRFHGELDRLSVVENVERIPRLLHLLESGVVLLVVEELPILQVNVRELT